MNDLLHALARIPRPRLSPFFSARAAARAAATHPHRRRRAPLLLWAYWLAVAFAAGATLLTSWGGFAVIVGLGGLVAASEGE